MNSILISFMLSILFAFSSCKTTPIVQENSNASEYLALGNQYARDGLFGEAANAYKIALKSDTNNMTIYRNLGMVEVVLKSYSDAIEHLEHSIGSYQNDFESNWYLAEAYRGKGKFSEAIYRYQTALKVKPNSPKTLKPLAWSYYKIRYYAQALKIAKKLRRISPNDTEASIILARIYLRLNKTNTALKILAAAKDKSDKSAKPYLASVEGDIYLELDNCQKASELFRFALTEQPLLAGALLGIGRCLYRGGDQKSAVEYITRATRLKPSLIESYYYLGRMHEKTNKPMAIKYYRKFYRKAAKDPEFLEMAADVKKRVSLLKGS